MSTSRLHLEEAIAFRQAMGQPINTSNMEVHDLQFDLIEEEFKEFEHEYKIEFEGPTGDVTYRLEEQLKELADLVFVCYQYAVARGWDLDQALTRVFQSNMSKLVDGKPLRREDGKILKGPNYQPPNLSDLVKKT
jgi:predicted HAD superfamily Cof-like phosphohydrolase